MEIPELRGFWLPDNINSEINFGNHMNDYGMQPELFSGTSRATETAISPEYNLDGNLKRQTSQGKFFSLNMVKFMNYQKVQLSKGFTLVLKIDFKALPLSGDSIFVEIKSNKIIQLFITSDGHIKVKANSQALLLHTSSFTMTSNSSNFSIISCTILRNRITSQGIIILDSD